MYESWSEGKNLFLMEQQQGIILRPRTRQRTKRELKGSCSVTDQAVSLRTDGHCLTLHGELAFLSTLPLVRKNIDLY